MVRPILTIASNAFKWENDWGGGQRIPRYRCLARLDKINAACHDAAHRLYSQLTRCATGAAGFKAGKSVGCSSLLRNLKRGSPDSRSDNGTHRVSGILREEKTSVAMPHGKEYGIHMSDLTGVGNHHWTTFLPAYTVLAHQRATNYSSTEQLLIASASEVCRCCSFL